MCIEVTYRFTFKALRERERLILIATLLQMKEKNKCGRDDISYWILGFVAQIGRFLRFQLQTTTNSLYFAI
jgi:hypothetical protein